jgi:hypothetical protein
VTSKKLKLFHPLADVLPLIEVAEFDRLVADISEHGLLNPITTYEGKILDGRNRARASDTAGVTPRYVEFDGKDPLPDGRDRGHADLSAARDRARISADGIRR